MQSFHRRSTECGRGHRRGRRTNFACISHPPPFRMVTNECMLPSINTFFSIQQWSLILTWLSYEPLSCIDGHILYLHHVIIAVVSAAAAELGRVAAACLPRVHIFLTYHFRADISRLIPTSWKGVFQRYDKYNYMAIIALKKLFKSFRIFSHIRSLGAAGALAVDICICFHDIES